MHWLAVLAVLLLACCVLPAAASDGGSNNECKELQWLSDQHKLALHFRERASTLEHKTQEQLRDLQQLSCRLHEDLEAVLKIAAQVECIEAELRNNKCHPTMCNELEHRLRQAIEEQEKLIKVTLKLIKEAEQLIQHAEKEARENLRRIEQVECDIAALIKLIERWQQSERREHEKRESAAEERREEKQEAEWRREIEALVCKIEAALEQIEREYREVEKLIHRIQELLREIERLLKALRCGLEAILDLLQRFHHCLEEAKELQWLDVKLHQARRFQVRAATLEHRTKEQLRDLQQLSCRLHEDLEAVLKIAAQVECIEAELRNNKCHPTMCNELEHRLRQAIEEQEKLIKVTLKLIKEAEQLIQHAEKEARENLRRIEQVECDIAALIKLIERWQQSERREHEKRESAAEERREEKQEAEWRREIEALVCKIEAALDDIAREADRIEHAIRGIEKLVCDIDQLVRRLLAGLGHIEKLFDELKCCWKQHA